MRTFTWGKETQQGCCKEEVFTDKTGHIIETKRLSQTQYVVAVYGTLSDLLSVASNKLGIKATSVYNGKGGLIDDIALIRDDDVLFVCEGEPFIDPQTDLKLPEGPTGAHTDWLTLNVGGRYFTTTRSTLVNKEPDSMLAHMFKDKGAWGNKQDHRGAFLIDRSPEYFEPILNYLRHGQLIVNDGINLLGVLEEARFFGIDSLIEHLEVAIKNSQPPEDHSPISRKEFVRFLLATPTKSELRCQGLNFSGADLSRLDLRYINFKMANLSRCNLAHANLCCANLERADLSGSVLDCANLQGVKMLCSNAEGASLKLCNFEDPSGLKANLEGANLKGVDMEGSQMTGINLRVATLKNAKLKNCNLRGATLAGTDLERDISHSKEKRGKNSIKLPHLLKNSDIIFIVVHLWSYTSAEKSEEQVFIFLKHFLQRGC
ncbi:BTB/POZ domain-containing protein KCTD9 isoform X1 [Notamacropus eugenii]|uniref:BTB/POZ domain-containing protein KCTD9 isoform X1 n=1 Tax=Notamacropus eugenii TaxID=9315 RepID=UPI003B67655F